MRYTVVESKDQLTICGPDIYAISKSHPRFPKVQGLVKDHKYEEAIEEIDRARAIQKHSNGKFWVNDQGIVMIDDEALPRALSDRLLSFVDHEPPLPTDSLELFWENCKRNPNPESVRDLYDFLSHNGIPITTDGRFLTYKKVAVYDDDGPILDKNGNHIQKGDLVDSRTKNSYRNNIGDTPSMPREEVDDNRNNTCSTGLHIAAWEYADGFCGNDGVTIEVVVDPADVVAVPVDYEKQKMRACRYEVVRIADDERHDILVNEDGSEIGTEEALEDLMAIAEKASATLAQAPEDAAAVTAAVQTAVDEEEDDDDDISRCPYCDERASECVCDEEDEDEKDCGEDDDDDEDWDDDWDDWDD
jgi:hypothetical protein